MTEQMTHTNNISSATWQVVTRLFTNVAISHGCYIVGELAIQSCLKLVWTKYKVVTRVVTLQQPCHQVLTSLAFLYGNPNRDRTPQRMESPVDRVAGLGGLTIQAHCLSGYSHYPPPQPLMQLLTQAVLPSCKPGCGNNLLRSLVVIHMMYVIYVLHKLYN